MAESKILRSFLQKRKAQYHDEDDRPPIKCRKCGAPIPREAPGSDVDCPRCGQTHNCFGQQIDYPQGRDEGYAGERWDDDY